MKVFNADPTTFAAKYAKDRYVLIKDGISKEFLEFAQNFAAQKKKDNQDMDEWEFKNKKKQYLFEFEGKESCPQSVFDFISTVCQLPDDKITLCERHIKIYEDIAETNPPAHKDRVASEVTVGIPLVVPDNSYIVLYPDDYLTVNPYNSTALWRTSLDEDELPENVLKNIEPLKVHANPGDVIIFEGNSIYHERVNPAHTSLLYLKFNGACLDPIGEDNRTVEQHSISKKLLASLSDDELLRCRIQVSPRLENVRRLYTRLHWKEVIQGNIVGQKEFTLSEFELQIILNTADTESITSVMKKLGIPAKHQLEHIPVFRRLGNLDALDFKYE